MSARASLWLSALLLLGCAGPADAVDPPEAPVASPVPVEVAPAVDTAAVSPSPGAATPRADPPAPRRQVPEPRKVGKETSPAPVPAPAPAPAAPKHPIAPKPAGISQVGDRSWTVTRQLVDQWQSDPYELGNVQEDGEGWQLIGVRQRPAYHLGMRNGDIVLEVNGHKLNTTANLMAAYLACKNDTQFDVVFLRKGARMTHHYAIVK
jgi:hypothetical protein